MGINERKEKEKEIRRNDIIEAAERVFFSKGYEGSTMDDVAKEAEFSKRTVYVYFNSKEQIYFEIMIRGYKLLIQELKAGMEKEKAGSSIDDFKKMYGILYKFSCVYPQYFDAIMEYENGELDFQNGISDKSREECYALGEEIMGYLAGLLRNGLEHGIIRRELDVFKTALVLWSCVNGVFRTARKKGNYIKNYYNTTSEEVVWEAFNLVIRSIQA